MSHAYPSQYLLDMPARVLFSDARGIEKWCHENDKCAPVLLDLGLARALRGSER